MENKKLGQPPLAARDQHLLQEALEGSGEIPMIVIVTVSVCGTILFLLNIVLISCFIHKKRKKEREQQKQAKGPGMSDGKQLWQNNGKQCWQNDGKQYWQNDDKLCQQNDDKQCWPNDGKKCCQNDDKKCWQNDGKQLYSAMLEK